jgi:hypothetical protein
MLVPSEEVSIGFLAEVIAVFSTGGATATALGG